VETARIVDHIGATNPTPSPPTKAATTSCTLLEGVGTHHTLVQMLKKPAGKTSWKRKRIGMADRVGGCGGGGGGGGGRVGGGGGGGGGVGRGGGGGGGVEGEGVGGGAGNKQKLQKQKNKKEP